MPQFLKITDPVVAEQWYRNGDLTVDKPLLNGDGRVVKPYHRDDVHGDSKCSLCGLAMSAHGWINPPSTTVAPVAPITVVDPVTGKAIVGAPAATPAPPVPKPAGKAKEEIGMVVCPGDWVVTHKTGVREVMKPAVFAHTYVSR